MDAFKYIKERTRMCKTISDDDGCESCTQYCVCYGLDDATDNDIIEAIVTVEEWAQENPPETRRSKLLKDYPNAKIDKEKDAPDFCVRSLGYEKVKNEGGCHQLQCQTCSNCRMCWNMTIND